MLGTGRAGSLERVGKPHAASRNKAGRGSVLTGKGAAQWYLSKESRADLVTTIRVSHSPDLQANP